MDKMKIEYWPIDKLIPYARNPRHNDAHVDRMAGVIKEFGWRVPIIAKPDGEIVAGHLRHKAARQLGLYEVPVIPADGMSDAQIKAFRILENKAGEWAGWDDDLLRIEIGELEEMNFDLELTGFNDEELACLTVEPEEQEPPDDFNEYGDDIETEYKCPKCDYEWSGKPKNET